MARPFWIAALFCMVAVCGSAAVSQGEKEKEKSKASMVARNSPALRDYFREIYGKTFADSLNDRVLNRILDDQIDEFVKRLVEKNLRLEEAAAQISAAPEPATQRHWIRRVREIAGDLEGTLRIWSDSLRPTGRAKETEPAMTAPRVAQLVEQVALYRQQIDQFLFPEEVSVSVRELQSEGFHRTLKRIQRIAQALED